MKQEKREKRQQHPQYRKVTLQLFTKVSTRGSFFGFVFRRSELNGTCLSKSYPQQRSRRERPRYAEEEMLSIYLRHLPAPGSRRGAPRSLGRTPSSRRPATAPARTPPFPPHPAPTPTAGAPGVPRAQTPRTSPQVVLRSPGVGVGRPCPAQPLPHHAPQAPETPNPRKPRRN